MITKSFDESTSVKKAIYDEQRKDLYVEFTSGITYLYGGVPKKTFELLGAARSPGKFVHYALNGKFSSTKVETPKPEIPQDLIPRLKIHDPQKRS